MSEPSRPQALALLGVGLVSGPALMLLLSEGGAPSQASVQIGFLNTVFAGFMLGSVFLILTLLAYGDSRDRPAAPVLGIIALVALGFLLGLRVLEAADLLAGNGTPQAQFFSDLVSVAPAVFGLSVSLLVGLLSAAVGLRRVTTTVDESFDSSELIS